jgi:hypothetical protein
MIRIRRFEKRDWPATWNMIEPVFCAGETCPYPPAIKQDEVCRAWIEQPAATYVATDTDDRITGSYYIKPNQPGLGSHVCNCGYIVAESARGKGVPPRCVNIHSMKHWHRVSGRCSTTWSYQPMKRRLTSGSSMALMLQVCCPVHFDTSGLALLMPMLRINYWSHREQHRHSITGMDAQCLENP